MSWIDVDIGQVGPPGAGRVAGPGSEHGRSQADQGTIDGVFRPVFQDGNKQYVIDGDGHVVYGVWLKEEMAPEPFIVEPEK